MGEGEGWEVESWFGGEYVWIGSVVGFGIFKMIRTLMSPLVQNLGFVKEIEQGFRPERRNNDV